MTDADATARPTSLKETFDRAVDLHRDGKLDEAAAIYAFYLRNNPGSPTAWTNFGALLRKQGRFAESIAAHRKALELDPKLTSVRSNLSNALCDNGEAAEAVVLREELLAAEPDSWPRIRDLAVAYRGCKRDRDAVALIDEAEARLGPNDEGRLQRSLANLMLGNYAAGFADFEGRFAGDEVSLPKDVPWPRWTGGSVDGQRVLVMPEQGFGDAILMSRFLPRLQAMGARVTMIAKRPLLRLLSGVEGAERIADSVRRDEEFDLYTPNMSLPHLVGLPEFGPPAAPRLTIPEDSRERARRIVAPFRGRFKIGVVWTGSLTYRANHRRSTEPSNFLGLATVPGVQLFSLYKGDGHKAFIESGMRGLILDACGDDRDFADTAAIIDEMDLMITTDTAVVHIAGSLGKPIWNLLNWEGFWLYGRGEKTPWYPSMRLFRQRENGDWDELFARVEKKLRAHLKRLKSRG